MKMIKLLSVVVCASFLMAGATWATDAPAKKCCEPVKDAAAQKDCACKCCKKAMKKGELCPKCHPKDAK